MFKPQLKYFLLITLPLLIMFWIGVFTLNLKLIVGIGIGYALLRVIVWGLMPWMVNHPVTLRENPGLGRRLHFRNDLLIKQGRVTLLGWIVVIFWVVAAPLDIIYEYYLYKAGRVID